MTEPTPLRPRPTEAARVPELNLKRMLAMIIEQRSLVMAVALGLGMLGLVTGVLKARTYTSTATFITQSKRQDGALGALSAQFGLMLPGGDATVSPAFYTELAKSRPVLSALVDTTYSCAPTRTACSRRLDEALNISNSNALKRRELTIDELRKRLAISYSTKTGVIQLSDAAPDPQLAYEITARAIDVINRFNLETRRTQASDERKFAEQRVSDVRGELRAAEDQLQQFLQRNRDYRNSSQLTFEQDRLSREVAFRQQLYTMLAQALEQSKIEEVRDTPTLVVIQRPEVPVNPNPRRLMLRVMLSLIVGLSLGVILALARAGWIGNQGVDSDQERLLSALRDAGRQFWPGRDRGDGVRQ